VASHVLRALAALATVAVLTLPASAFAALPPHVTEDTQTAGSCAICHRAHTANVSLGYRSPLAIETTGNALIIAPASEFGSPGFPAPARGDVGLCYTCHGSPGLGSQFDVETSFTLESTHSLIPLTSSFGPSPKVCGSCHDPHGADRVSVGGAPYPKLLRSWTDTSTAVFSREEFCASCHKVRAASRFDGLAVYRMTGHYTGMPDPANGTKIRCSNCHVAHGSSIAPLISSVVTTPGAGSTAVVAANDRRLCLTCHPEPKHTWSGETTYGASAHALSTATVAVSGEWPAAGAKRRVGECQVCHAAMGRGDGSGGAVPSLLEKPGRQLCDTCHAPSGVAKTDLKSLAYPAAEASALELALAWGPGAETAARARVDVYSRATAGAAPRDLIGPRAYAAAGSGGVAAAGDVDGDGQAELVVADRGNQTLTIRHRDALLGLSDPGPAAIGVTPDHVAIGRFIAPLADLVGLPQVAIVDATTGQLYLFANIVGNTMTQVAGPIAVGTAPSGIVAGDLGGTGLADLVVTSAGSDEVRVFTQDPGSATAFLPATVVSTGAGTAPRGPSIGDVDTTASGNEIVVCLSGGTGAVRVYDVALGTVGADLTPAGGPGSAVPWASTIADVLPSVTPAARNGLELAIAMQSAAAESRLAVYAEAAGPGTGLDAASALYYDTSVMDRAGSLVVADVDGDGAPETVLGNAGLWAGAAGAIGPSADVYRPSGAALTFVRTLRGDGTELAGSPPALVAADFGGVLPSRHPIDEVSASHVSTETGAFARHVTCSDCHSSHEASGTLVTSAPAVTRTVRGAWGFAVTNTAAGAQTLAGAARASNQYEVCFKCHATSSGRRSDIAALVNDQNASVHAVEAVSLAPAALPGSYVGSWGNGSVLYCTDCHGNAAGALEPAGGHRSAAAPLLRRPFLGVTPDTSGSLCFGCHKSSTYYDGAAPGGTDGAVNTSSRFFDTTRPSPWLGITVAGSLHKFHSRMYDTAVPADGGLGFGCGTCHVSHGSVTKEHLIRADIGWTHIGPNGGSCTNLCHSNVAKIYTYDGP